MPRFFRLCLSLCVLSVVAPGSQANAVPPLPEPVTNNAVAAVKQGSETYLVSMMGLGPGKTYTDVHNRVWQMALGDKQWRAGTSVPGSLPLKGRLASVAVSVGEHVLVFGGYTVAADHSEISSPDSYRYDPKHDVFALLPPMPVAVDDAVAVVHKDRYVYLISGWHNDGNVNLVQMYDSKLARWHQASPLPGHGVFGHAGGIVDGKLVVCDGVKVQPRVAQRRTFTAETRCFLGRVDDADPKRIDWSLIPHPTGRSRYRMAAAGVAELGSVVFVGGTHNPYNYNGVGYDGQPAAPDAHAWIYDVAKGRWRILSLPVATMDHRGLVAAEGKLYIIGGMGPQQRVLPHVHALDIAKLKEPTL